MNIVNITNSYQGYIILSIPFSPEIQMIILVVGLIVFVAAFTFSIIMLRRENIPHRDRYFTPAPAKKKSNPTAMKRSLLSAFSELETAKQLISNLEELKGKKIIDEESYKRYKNEYSASQEDALSAIDAIKINIKSHIDSLDGTRLNLVQISKNLTKEHLSGSPNKGEHKNKLKNVQAEIIRIDKEIAYLRKLLEAKGTFDVIVNSPDASV